MGALIVSIIGAVVALIGFAVNWLAWVGLAVCAVGGVWSIIDLVKGPEKKALTITALIIAIVFIIVAIVVLVI